jgi:hypothetical protein
VADLVPRPEPTTRASDKDRDRVLSLLSTATADGRLTVEEHQDLMTRTLHARTVGELDTITSDLAIEEAAKPLPVAPSPSPKKGFLAIFGARTRKGSWQVPTEFRAKAFFGAVELDFRDATFDAPEVLCVASSMFGAIEITVPEWVRVIDEGTAIFGAREEKGASSAQAPRVTLRLRGMSVFGALEVRHKPSRNADPAIDGR